MIHRSALRLFLACALFLSLHATGQAQTALNDLVRETQKQAGQTDRIRLVWWVPSEFWEAVMEQSPSVTPEQAQEFVSVLAPYALFLVADGEVGPFGGVDWTSEEEIREGIALQVGEAEALRPLDDSEVGADALNFTNMMRPVLSGMLGKTGENLQYFFFASAEAEAEPLLKAKEKGEFTVTVLGEAFQWRLPLGSLLPPKLCPVDGERMSGAWSYCPWHGSELKTGSQ